MTLKVQILQTLRRFFIILVGLMMTWFSEKCLFSIYADVVWGPTWSKNLGRYLMANVSHSLRCTMYIYYHITNNHSLWYLILRSTQEYLEKSVFPYWEMAGGGLVWIPWLPQFNTMLSCALGRWLCMNYKIFEYKEASYATTRIVRQD